MHFLHVRNVNEAYVDGLQLIREQGYERNSRNGPVLVLDDPAMITYKNPRERVLFNSQRDANPFFHLFESLWMLAGRNDVAFPTKFVKSFAQFSDDGETFHGAYGKRWVEHFGVNQIMQICGALKSNPDDRRCVLTMWDPVDDLGFQGKDFPCNTHAYFKRDQYGNLDMTVCNRSNDMIWGAFGANAVHFSVLQEFMATVIGCGVGKYHQFTNNLHAYKEVLEPLEAEYDWNDDPYDVTGIDPYPLMSVPPEHWIKQLHMFLDEPKAIGFTDPFFREVARPMLFAHQEFKSGKGVDKFLKPIRILADMPECDWKYAAINWMNLRHNRWLQAQDDGVRYE